MTDKARASTEAPPVPWPVAVISIVKHDYVPDAILSHARYRPVVVTDDADQPRWVHERNEAYAHRWNVPYVRGVEQALADYRPAIGVVCSEAERHCDLSVRAADAGLHVVQDKPMSTQLSECDRVVRAVKRNDVRFLMWNRNLLPAIVQARQIIQAGRIGRIVAAHADFYFAKDAGPPIGTRAAVEPPIDWLTALKAAHQTGADGGVGTRPMGELEVEGIYPLAYLMFLTSASFVTAFARTTAHFHQLHADNRVDDLATVSLTLADGTVGSLCLGRIGNASHPDIGEIKLHLQGTEGSLVVNESRPEVATYYRDQPATEFPHRRVANQNDWLLADELANAIDEHRETLLDARASRHLCATVKAALKSSQSGRPEPIDPP